MTQALDLCDIQGNVVRAYGRFGFPIARYLLLNISVGAGGRSWLTGIIPDITKSATWRDESKGVLRGVTRPKATLNMAINHAGLAALELPLESLNSFSAEFSMGMKMRKDITGDIGLSSPEHWDPVWQGEDASKAVHVLLTINASTREELEMQYGKITDKIAQSLGAVTLLDGHRGPNGSLLPYQEAQLIYEGNEATSKEHFKYTDGIGDPFFEGIQDAPARVKGRGKQMPDGTWKPLATGEFLHGHLDEAREYPPAATPILLSRNGTYMVYRKLHQYVASFDALLEREGAAYPGGKELMAAKFVGRWRTTGAPLVKVPDEVSHKQFEEDLKNASKEQQDEMLSNFTYDADMSGARCPISSHIRRINPRASLELKAGKAPGEFVRNAGIIPKLNAFDTPGALANRRRILRRGLPYGDSTLRNNDNGDHGVIMMMLNADIGRQYEFVQQQWVNYGNDFREANDKDVILGNRSDDIPGSVIHPADPEGDAPPRFVCNIPRLVETRGGDYFFVPSLTALRLIARGLIDPT
jgi:deferrochelatase/peroxidase EfeB